MFVDAFHGFDDRLGDMTFFNKRPLIPMTRSIGFSPRGHRIVQVLHVYSPRVFPLEYDQGSFLKSFDHQLADVQF